MTATVTERARPALARRAGAAGTLGAVATGSPVAAGIGVATLLSGGNCVDAAVASALAETVCIAPKCGLAGDLVALVLAPGASEPEALVAVGPAAGELAAAVAAGALPATGGLSVGVPGAPAGYAALAERGRLPLWSLVRPAVELARRGFAWSEQCAALAAEADALLLRHQPQGCAFRPATGPLRTGACVRLPGLARLLGEFATLGPDLFAGEIGRVVVDTVRSAGGVISTEDLHAASAVWAPAHTIDLGAAGRVWTTPGPTYGPALLSVLARAVGEHPAALAATVAEILATQAAGAGDGVDLRAEGTSVVATTDAEGGAAVVVHSNSFPQFGSGVVVAGLDLVLSNRAGRGFSSDPASPNHPAAGRRPLTTLHAWATGPTRPALLGGTPGGEQQVAWNAQFLTRLLDDRAASVGDAITAPLWRLDGGGVTAEADAEPVTVDTRAVPPLSMRSAQVVVAPPDASGLARAWADPRIDTVALAV